MSTEESKESKSSRSKFIFQRTPQLIQLLVLLLIAYVGWLSIPQRIEPEGFNKDHVLSHLRGLQHLIEQKQAVEKMQKIFPEGACFTLVIYGLSWSNAFPHLSPEEQLEARDAMSDAIARMDESLVIQPFTDTQVPKGVFYLGQRNLLLGKYLKTFPEDERLKRLPKNFTKTQPN